MQALETGASDRASPFALDRKEAREPGIRQRRSYFPVSLFLVVAAARKVIDFA